MSTSTEARRGSARPIDPRIRARRVAVRREQGRRRLRILLGLVALASLVGVAWLVVESPLLDVDHVDVTGSHHLSAEEVRRASGVVPGAALLRLDLDTARRRVEAMPWVATAKVHRDLPGRVRIAVTERVPAAWSRAPGGGVAVLDTTGRVLEVDPQPPAGLPEVVGLTRVPGPGHTARPAAGARLAHALPTALRSRVASVLLDGANATLRLAVGPDGTTPAGEIRFGPVAELETKAAAALAVLDQLGDRTVHYIDVRVPGAPATG